MSEAAVVRASVRELDKRGAAHFNLGPGNGDTGLPDRHALYLGTALYLEFKDPERGVVAPKQQWWLDRLRAAGGIALVVTDVAQVAAALDEIELKEAAKWSIIEGTKRPRAGCTAGATAPRKEA